MKFFNKLVILFIIGIVTVFIIYNCVYYYLGIRCLYVSRLGALAYLDGTLLVDISPNREFASSAPSVSSVGTLGNPPSTATHSEPSRALTSPLTRLFIQQLPVTAPNSRILIRAFTYTMADPNQYKYAAMSNLVLRADKSLMDRVRRTDDATGDPESLSGKVNFRDMGGRVARNEAPKDKLLRRRAKAEKGKKKSGQELEDEDMTAGARKRRREYVYVRSLSLNNHTTDWKSIQCSVTWRFYNTYID